MQKVLVAMSEVVKDVEVCMNHRRRVTGLQ